MLYDSIFSAVWFLGYRCLYRKGQLVFGSLNDFSACPDKKTVSN